MAGPTRRLNVVVIMADDLGYADLGCYGGEIRTPQLDALAARGTRLTRFYVNPRCSPSRASLLTGLHPHQTGIGILTHDDSPVGYRGTLSPSCPTLAEVLRSGGYATGLSGKWHLSGQLTEPDDSWPTRRGFDDFFGTITGCGSYYDPGTLTRGERNAEPEAREPGFFYTDAIADHAVGFVDRCAGSGRPFFLYAAFTAPHWPLHAGADHIAAYDGVYADGWDVVRRRRFERQRELGIVPPEWTLSPRDPDVPAWTDVARPGWQQRRMQAYAAMVEQLDRGVGRILDALRANDVLDDTLVVFLSDNGASDEELPKGDLERFRARTDIVRTRTRDDRPVRIGNDPTVGPGPEDTYASYGAGWANVSNTPFRLFKRWTHEGGVAAPCIVSWPAGGIPAGALLRSPGHIIDLLPTVLAATGATHPADAAAPEGVSLLEPLRGGPTPDRTLCWEHTGNAAVRTSQWKAVRRFRERWELYDVETDPTELCDRADRRPDVVAELAEAWTAWADRVGVIPFEHTVRLYESRGLGQEDAQA